MKNNDEMVEKFAQTAFLAFYLRDRSPMPVWENISDDAKWRWRDVAKNLLHAVEDVDLDRLEDFQSSVGPRQVQTDAPQDNAPNTNANPLSEQVGGCHYKDAKIQPVEFIHANGVGYIEGNVIKYVSRHRQKNGRADIEKAIHYLQLLMELEYKGVR